MPGRSIPACELLLAALCFVFGASAQEVYVVSGGANLLHRAPIRYPLEALENGIHGAVTIEASINDRGVVTDAHVTSGLALFRKPALLSVLDWHYLPGTPSPVQIAVDFTIDPVRVTGALVAGPPPTVFPKHDAGTIAEIRFAGITSQLEQAILRKLPVREGDIFQTDMILRISDAIQDVDEHIMADYHLLDFDGERRFFELRISYRVPGSPAGPPDQ